MNALGSVSQGVVDVQEATVLVSSLQDNRDTTAQKIQEAASQSLLSVSSSTITEESSILQTGREKRMQAMETCSEAQTIVAYSIQQKARFLAQRVQDKIATLEEKIAYLLQQEEFISFGVLLLAFFNRVIHRSYGVKLRYALVRYMSQQPTIKALPFPVANITRDFFPVLSDYPGVNVENVLEKLEEEDIAYFNALCVVVDECATSFASVPGTNTKQQVFCLCRLVEECREERDVLAYMRDREKAQRAVPFFVEKYGSDWQLFFETVIHDGEQTVCQG